MRSSLPSAFLAAAALLFDRTSVLRLPVASAKSRPSGGSRPSPTPPSASRPTGSSPSYSPPTGSSPSYSRPTAPTRPSFSSPTGPVSPTNRNAYNPNPSYKPLSPSGAPTVRSGGGGFSSGAKRFAKAAAIGAAAGAVVIAAGYFFYGGRHSSPYCRGSDEDRFLSGRCPRGQSSQAHTCKSNIPLCPIPELVRGKWNLGGDALPKVDIAFDNSVCSVVALPAVTLPAATNTTNATNATNSTTTPAASNSTVDGIEGESGLDDCLRRIVDAGGCDSQGVGNLFLYDDDTGACGCCASAQIAPLADATFASAVYSHRPADDLSAAPLHCVSGSVMYYPDATAGGADVAHPCECGACAACGAGAPRFLDWSGPYAVIPNDTATATGSRPLYDPVDTCLCDDSSAGQCESDFLPPPSAAGVHSSNLVAASSAIFLLLHFLRH